ncbi:aminopeptidase P family protein [Mesorhizobium sp. M4A.F.Ca.ET.050.02.1.1]|uniref:M24 family metallopeptidase n=1 Tax=Mesorhizobium sp. M4A.F.Ca.ET.050.02.1.1 TaxID=2496754 RepID=UPI000FCB23C8|nr:Xaa-Pro peptidase family protein [Mesorhizobium sp. M4A.F.Ca.ET.050.02.1.1]RUX51508.1 aminopeptidase P family protein [Mesorhizobium sp. M4A.F.Ca.ET.050.02.1.1]
MKNGTAGESKLYSSSSITMNARPLPPSPSVPLAELEMRLSRARIEMNRDAIDVMILTDEKNVNYFTDYRTFSWGYNARPVLAVITNDHLLIVGSLTESKLIESAPRVFTTLLYDGYLPEAVDSIADWIGAMPAAGGRRIAVDFGPDMFGRGSLHLIDRLRDLASDRSVTSAVDLLWRVRLIKTPFEAAMKKVAFDIVNRAFDQAIANAYPGITEFELCQMMQAQIYLNGAESAPPIAMLFSDGDFFYGRHPSERRLRQGHYIWTDFRATYGGYPADRNRIARCGDPTDWEIGTYERVRSLTIELANSFKPGLRCCDIFNKFQGLWKDADLGQIYGQVSRIGHGGGLDVTEPPSISAADETVIEPGMIFHVEPKLEKNGAVFQFEEVVFITDGGVEFLSELSPERVPVIK